MDRRAKKTRKKNTQTGKILLKIFLLSLIPELFLSIYKLTGAVAQSLRDQEGHAPSPHSPLQFPNQTRSNSFSFKHQGYCFLRVFRNYADQRLHDS